MSPRVAPKAGSPHRTHRRSLVQVVCELKRRRRLNCTRNGTTPSAADHHPRGASPGCEATSLVSGMTSRPSRSKILVPSDVVTMLRVRGAVLAFEASSAARSLAGARRNSLRANRVASAVATAPNSGPTIQIVLVILNPA